jgi:hypothetical protein
MEEAAPIAKESWVADMSSYRPPKAVQQHIERRVHKELYNTELKTYQGPERRISDKLKERPTMGLVNHVLGDGKYYRGHSKFMGKSY